MNYVHILCLSVVDQSHVIQTPRGIANTLSGDSTLSKNT